MAKLVKAGETTATKKRLYFYCTDATDGLTPEAGEAGGQPQISINGGDFTDTGIGVLSAVLAPTTGWYYAELTDGAVDTAGRHIEGRYKSANTAEALARDSIQVVAFDPDAVAGLGLSNLDATVSGVPAAVWAIATSTLTGAGTVGKLIVDNLNAAVGSMLTAAKAILYFKTIWRKDVTADADLAAGGTATSATDSLEAIRDTEPLGTAMRGTDGAYTGTPPTVEQIQSGLALEATLTAIKGAGWTTETLKAIYTAAASALGTGGNPVTLTLEDGSGNAVPNIVCICRNAAEDAVLARATTDANGQVEFQLDDGSYKVRYGPSGAHTFSNPYTLTVSGTTAATHTCAALTIPASSDPALCTCYADIRYVDGGELVGANEGWLKIIKLVTPRFPDADTGTAARGRTGDTYYTNASGRVQVDLIRGSVVQIQMGLGATDRSAEELSALFEVTVPDAASYEITQAV